MLSHSGLPMLPRSGGRSPIAVLGRAFCGDSLQSILLSCSPRSISTRPVALFGRCCRRRKAAGAGDLISRRSTSEVTGSGLRTDAASLEDTDERRVRRLRSDRVALVGREAALVGHDDFHDRTNLDPSGDSAADCAVVVASDKVAANAASRGVAGCFVAASRARSPVEPAPAATDTISAPCREDLARGCAAPAPAWMLSRSSTASSRTRLRSAGAGSQSRPWPRRAAAIQLSERPLSSGATPQRADTARCEAAGEAVSEDARLEARECCWSASFHAGGEPVACPSIIPRMGCLVHACAMLRQAAWAAGAAPRKCRARSQGCSGAEVVTTLCKKKGPGVECGFTPLELP